MNVRRATSSSRRPPKTSPLESASRTLTLLKSSPGTTVHKGINLLQSAQLLSHSIRPRCASVILQAPIRPTFFASTGSSSTRSA
jgi:hypothetical protein